ncbi:DUF2637 domain-containing protein [Spiractinospora alimapuensis]|uniref:DUF2637 domain-containing protein n=1 Tax=Spiractinospora alimapuensis TaxID=2820884 RepID=UPI001F3A8F9B|nr:DUF2637 domain-containing protein [Spiractinospora alimapuensis]QVQ53397.1 DUF2637 domain-containing protein [Spiractinospora alimapuensis]
MSSPVLRWTTIGAVLLLAGIAAVVSYSHMYDLALRHGEPEWRAALFPLSVDGMVVAASMTLLADARQGRRGGVLPWSLLILGSLASLAANVAVADPTVWSRIIHAWPSVALIGSYELLMRQFRGAASIRDAHAVRTQTNDDQANDDRAAGGAVSEPEGVLDRPDLRVVHERGWSSSKESVGSVATDSSSPPELQCEAWEWALAHRREDGSLPTGEEVAEQFERKPRWGRLVKQRGERGLLNGSNGRADENAEDQVVKSGVPGAGAVV